MQSPTRTSLVTLTDIAVMAQVKRAAVSNWRRRYPDFPSPVAGNTARPLYDGTAIVNWLITSGIGNAEPEHLEGELAMHTLVAHGHQLGPRRTVEILGSLLCLRQLDGMPLLPDRFGEAGFDPDDVWAVLIDRAERMDPDDEFVLRELRAAGSSAWPLVQLTEELVEAAYTTGSAYEWLLASRARLGLAELNIDTPSSELTQLLAGISDIRSRCEHGPATVADPCARAGDLLVAVLSHTDDPSELRALAAEPEEWLARLTRRRLLLAGISELSLDVQRGTELEEQLADIDILVTQVPYQPAEGRSVLDALDAVEGFTDLLGPGSTALVLGPATALVDALPGTEAARRRSDLLRSGLVESVIVLPGGMIPHRPGYRTALWTLTRDPVQAAQGYVLLADVSNVNLTEHVRASLIEDVVLWRAEGRRPDGHEPRFGRIVSVARLDAKLGEPLTLTGPSASQLLAREVEERPALISELEHQLRLNGDHARRYIDAQGPVRSEIVRRVGSPPQHTAVATLLADKRVKLLSGHRLDPTYILPTGHHPVIGSPELDDNSPWGARRIDRFTLAANYEYAALTEPGDIVYTTGQELRTLIDHEGFSVVTFPARVLRVVPHTRRPLTSRVLAALLGAAWYTGRSSSAIRPARRIEEYTIIDLNPEEVTRLDALLADIEHRQQLLAEQQSILAELRRLVMTGLSDGTLTIDADNYR